MANKQTVKIELDHAGMRQLLLSQEVAEAVTAKAQAIADHAGNSKDYVVKAHSSGQRTIVNVIAATKAAKRDNAKNDTLVKAIQAMRE